MKKMRLVPKMLVLAAAIMTATNPVYAKDTLQEQFSSPPDTSKPRAWWHWINGNITANGVEKDLLWMKQVGLGGATSFDVQVPSPQLVDKPVRYMSPEWQDIFRKAASKAASLNLELAIATSAGWSETGGPWVKPADSNKKIVWSEAVINGGQLLKTTLPKPPSVNGPYQDFPVQLGLAAVSGVAPPKIDEYFQDIAVYALKVKAASSLPTPTMVVDGQSTQAAALENGRLANVVPLGDASQKPVQIDLDYGEIQSVRSATIYIADVINEDGPVWKAEIQASNDGETWRHVSETKLSELPVTMSFAEQQARYFRVLVTAKLPHSSAFRASNTLLPGVDIDNQLKYLGISESVPKLEIISLSGDAKVNHFEQKAGFATAHNYFALDHEIDPIAPATPLGEVIDLTSKMSSDGSLSWEAPSGQWKIIRMGYSLTGKMNHPATSESTGLEVDKYDGNAVRRYLEHYLSIYKDAVQSNELPRSGLTALTTDSIESGTANWTPELVTKFKSLRGYDPTPWLPTLTGAIIESRIKTDAFLYDYRRTLSDLIATEHYKTIADVAHENGLTVYGESLEYSRPVLGDDMDMRRYATIPMAAIWAAPTGEEPTTSAQADIRGAASVAHIYGQNLVAAESFTSMLAPWAFAPADLRRTADFAFAQGLNRPVIHASAHVPRDDMKPGISLSIFGQTFNRHESWASMAKPWVEYLTRSSLLLQQGRYQADVAYFYGEESSIVTQAADGYFQDAPKRYGYDFVNATALTDALKVQDGKYVAPSGAQYRVLYLGRGSDQMTLPVLKRLAQLVEQGGIVVGKAPTGSPSLADDPETYAALVNRLWSSKDVTPLGKGRVIAETDVEAALRQLKIHPDFEYRVNGGSGNILYTHRKLEDGDIYFVSNREPHEISATVNVRVTGKAPEIWRAEDASIEPVGFSSNGLTTTIALNMKANESYFLVLRKNTQAKELTITTPHSSVSQEVSGPWEVSFEPGHGATKSVKLERLTSLTAHPDNSIKYFSGVASYKTNFNVSSTQQATDTVLDLGTVGDIAEVVVNGKVIGTAWHPPYQIKLGSILREGNNELEIRVANLWVNRLIGDAQLGKEDRIAKTTIPTYLPDAPLRPAGLIGPIKILKTQR